MAGAMAVTATSFTRTCACTVYSALTPQQALSTHASAGHSWTLMGKSGSVSYGDTAPFSWIPVCIRFCLGPPRVCFSVSPVLWKFYNQIPLASKV